MKMSPLLLSIILAAPAGASGLLEEAVRQGYQLVNAPGALSGSAPCNGCRVTRVPPGFLDIESAYEKAGAPQESAALCGVWREIATTTQDGTVIHQPEGWYDYDDSIIELQKPLPPAVAQASLVWDGQRLERQGEQGFGSRSWRYNRSCRLAEAGFIVCRDILEDAGRVHGGPYYTVFARVTGEPPRKGLDPASRGRF